ncbi:MAG: hypothetical protein ACXWC3_23170 [Burkholderiales bacterium]
MHLACIRAKEEGAADVVTKLNAAVVSAFSNEAVHARLADLRQEIFARERLAPAALAAYHKAEIAKR